MSSSRDRDDDGIKADDSFFFANEAEDHEEKTAVDAELGSRIQKRLRTDDLSQPRSSQPSAPPPPPSGVRPSRERRPDPEDQTAVSRRVTEPPSRSPAPSRSEPPAPFAEEESLGLAQETTQIIGMEEVRGRKQAGVRLVVRSGPDAGKEYAIEFNEIYVGRGMENDFVVFDRAVSRKHFRIRKRLDDVILKDLGSGNGTSVNGTRVDEIMLQNGDLIQAGNSTIEFVNPDEPRQIAAASRPSAPVPKPAPPVRPSEPRREPAPQPPPVMSARRDDGADVRSALPPAGQKPMVPLWFVGLVVLLAVAALVYVAYQQQTPPPAPAAVDQSVIDTRGLVEEGRSLMQQKNFLGAVTRFEMVLREQRDNAEAAGLLARSREEMGHQNVLAMGRTHFAEGRYAEAEQSLNGVPQTSVFHPEARDLLDRIARRGEIEKMIEAGRQAFDSGQLNEAALQFDRALAIDPNNATARDYKQRIADRQAAARIEEEKKQQQQSDKLAAQQKRDDERAAREREAAAARAAQAQKARDEAAAAKRAEQEEARARAAADAAARASQYGADSVDRAIAQYKGGDLPGAVAALAEISENAPDKKVKARATGIHRVMKQFQNAYDSGVEAWKAKSPDKGIASLKQAAKYDQTLASGTPFAAEIQSKLADLYFVKGNGAMLEEDYETAIENLQAAVRTQPGHPQATKALDNIAKNAQKLYYQGYALKATDPAAARRKWDAVLKIAPPDDKWHQKALEGLKTLPQ